MRKNILSPLIILSIFFLLFVAITLNSSCSKSDTPAPVRRDTVIPPPPVPPVIKDTPSYVKRIEVDYIQSNPPITRRQTDYTFYYDTQNRVIKVGIKNYGPVLFDTATTLLFYTGYSVKPNSIIAPNLNRSSVGNIIYDTTYFEYDAFDRIVKDSSTQEVYNNATSTYVRKPVYRYYAYPSATKTFTRWYGRQEGSAPLGLIREDTLDHTADSQIVKLKSQLYYSELNKLNYALGEAFNYSGLVNPLSKLNISGTIFSLIYTPVSSEVLGNRSHKAVHNSNIFPFFLDFYSRKVASSFYLGGFTSNDFLIAAQYDHFVIEAIPWTQRTTYPSKIKVGASTALDDKVEYRYYY
jgi:hypothetical protein